MVFEKLSYTFIAYERACSSEGFFTEHAYQRVCSSESILNNGIAPLRGSSLKREILRQYGKQKASDSIQIRDHAHQVVQFELHDNSSMN